MSFRLYIIDTAIFILSNYELSLIFLKVLIFQSDSSKLDYKVVTSIEISGCKKQVQNKMLEKDQRKVKKVRKKYVEKGDKSIQKKSRES